uniref:Uncharacterized protein n=2 Tax=Oryza sativa subsp. japonica TaxID=39947 RepID=Q10HX9_ORYSJ|nr:hypothetical protein [Oryza sativa Japonica Group]ABF97211.1 hypothetical protein LOC_Os03g37520 [Oryza sativa Japonica Group]
MAYLEVVVGEGGEGGGEREGKEKPAEGMGRPASACSSAAPSLLNPRPPVRSASIRAAGSSPAALGLIRACHVRPLHGHHRRRYWEWGLAMGRRGAVWGCRPGKGKRGVGRGSGEERHRLGAPAEEGEEKRWPGKRRMPGEEKERRQREGKRDLELVALAYVAH